MRWWARLLRRTRVERQLDAELRFHIEQQMADLIRGGLSEAEARRRLHAEFGGLDQVKEDCRDVRGTRTIETLLQDLRYAWRGLLAHPAFTLVVVLSLALGIGANTAAYTVLYAALLRPAAVPEPHGLVQLVPYDAAGDHDENSWYGYPLYTRLRDALRARGDAIAMCSQQMHRIVVDNEGLEKAIVEPVSANYFAALRIAPREGRLFVDADDRLTGGEAVAVISHAYRERRFGAEAPVLGRTLTIDDKPFTIVGVAADGFDGLEAQARTDIWVPVTAKLPPHQLASYGSMMMRVMARMRPGADLGRATAVADLTYQRYLQDHFLPTLPAPVKRVFAARHLRMREAPSGLTTIGLFYRKPLLVLMGFVTVILLLCCANVANLLLARQRARAQEFAVRLSLGAGPGRLARQLLTETLLLGAMGAFVGLVLAQWGSRGLVRLLPESRVPIALDLTPDARVFGFAAAIALLSAIAVGLIPAWRAARTDAGATLTHNTRTVLRPRASRSLVVVQLAGSVVLLVTALLMAQTLQNLRGADLGFRPHEVLAFELSMPSTFPVGPRAALYQRLVDRIEASPGVVSVTYSRESLYANGGWAGGAVVPGQEAKADRQIALLQIGPRFFETAGITRVGGRAFEPGDHREGALVTLLNETAAQYFFGTTDVVGQRIQVNGKVHEVIGLVRDVKHYGAREQPCGGRVAYLPIDRAAASGGFLVRGTIPAADLQRIVREELRDVSDTVLIERLRPLLFDVDDMVARERMVGRLAGGFALLALAIAAVGIYGVLAYGVTQRTGEIGLRAALGAAPPALRRMILREAFGLVAIGLLLGVPIAFASVRLLGSLLFGVTPTDPITFGAAALVLAATAALAAWLPARRAAAVDPTTALRTT